MSFLDSVSKRAIGVHEIRANQPVSNAPYSALSPMSWQTNKQPMFSDYNDEDALFTAQRRNIYAYRCVQKISNSIAGLPYRVGDPLTFKFNLGAPLANLLGPAPGSPNPIMSAAQLWRYSIAQYLILGKFAWLINRNPKTKLIDSLYPLQAQYVFPIPVNRGYAGTNYFAGYRYGVPAMPGYIESINPDDIVFVHNMSWGSPLKPQSPFQAAGVTINIHTLIDTQDFSLMKNGVQPSGMWITPPFATKEDRDAFRKQFVSEFGGVQNAGKAMFGEREVEPGDSGSDSPDPVQWVATGLTPRDAQLSILRDQKVRDICMSFGVPLSVLGDSTLAKYTNMAQDRRNYWETCQEICHDITDTINIQLAPKLGTQVGWWDYRTVPELAPVPVLPSGSEAVAQVGVLYTADEWRAERGLDPMPEVVQPDPVPVDTNPVDAVVPPVNAPALMTSGRSAPRAAFVLRHVPEDRHAGPNHESLPSGHNTVHVLEQVMSKQLKVLFAEQAKTVQDRLKGRRTKHPTFAEDIFDKTFWENRMYGLLEPIFESQGYPDIQIRQMSVDITTQTLSQIESALVLPVHTDDPTRLISTVSDILLSGPERAFTLLSTILREVMV